MLSKLRKKTNNEAESENKSSEISNKISKGIYGLVESVVTERKDYYMNNPAPSLDSLDSLISNCAKKNAAISGGAGLIPGPWGMAAAVPEILAVVRNQLIMVYDISKAYGQSVEKEVLISILFGAIGNGTTGLLVVQGQKIMAKRTGAKALQTLITALGGKITQQLAKSMAAKWLPVAGAIAMATWSNYSTKKIGNKAKSLFSEAINDESHTLEIADTEQEIDIESDIIDSEPSIISSHLIDDLKVSTMIKLMKIDGSIDDEEVEFISEFIENTDLSSSKKIELIGKIRSDEKIDLDYSVLSDDPDEKLYFLIDLISLAKSDSHFDITEKMFIKAIGKQLNFEKDDLEELVA